MSVMEQKGRTSTASRHFEPSHGYGGQGEAPHPKTPSSKEATALTEELEEQAQEETHNIRADAGRQTEHADRDYLDVKMFQERLEDRGEGSNRAPPRPTTREDLGRTEVLPGRSHRDGPTDLP